MNMNITMNNNHEINEQELQSINGGTSFFIVDPIDTKVFYIYLHKNCGGQIENVNTLHKMCRCKKCGEEHYSIFSFDCSEFTVRLRRDESEM